MLWKILKNNSGILCIGFTYLYQLLRFISSLGKFIKFQIQLGKQIIIYSIVNAYVKYNLNSELIKRKFYTHEHGSFTLMNMEVLFFVKGVLYYKVLLIFK